MARFLQTGETLNYTPNADTPAGTVVVQGDLLGVAVNDIAANKLGAISVEGVWLIEKGAGAISAGAKLWWNPTDKVVTATKGALSVVAGKAAYAALSGDAYVAVLLNEGVSADAPA